MQIESGWRRSARDVAMIAIGVLLGLLFDPRSGKRRRRMLRDRPLALARRGERRAERVAYRGAVKARAAAAWGRHLVERPSYDDVTLAHKVETEIFRYREVPKQSLNIDACDGMVTLRGQVDRPEIIAEIIARTRKVKGVNGVENLMHLPGTEAPHHQPNGRR
jgi:osmotically-inducible protein OsmY